MPPDTVIRVPSRSATALFNSLKTDPEEVDLEQLIVSEVEGALALPSMTTSNLTSASGEASVSSGNRGDSQPLHQPNQVSASGTASASAPSNAAAPPAPPVKKKRNLPGTPDPDAEVVALSPKTLMATNRFVCEICGKGFQRDQNLQLHRRGHNLPWKLRQRTSKEPRKRVYVCPEVSCVHHDRSRALGDLTGIKKHFCRKHGEKKWKCDKCNKRYAVQSDWKAHSKTCGTREYRCDCGTLFSRRDSFITHRAFCDALAEESARIKPPGASSATGASPLNPNDPSSAAGGPGVTAEGGSSSSPFNSVRLQTAGLNPSELSSGYDEFSLLGGGSRPWGASMSGTSGHPKLSLWLGPGPGGGPGPPNVIQQMQAGEDFMNLDPTGQSSSMFLPTGKGMQGLLGQYDVDMNPGRSAAGFLPPGGNLNLISGGGGSGGSFGLGGGSFSDLMGIPNRLDSTSGSGLSNSMSNGSSVGGSVPQMSATALLQKAAQMGATAGSNSLLRGFGMDSSSFGMGSIWGRSNQQQQHAQQQQRNEQFGEQFGNAGASSYSSLFGGAGMNCFPPPMFGDLSQLGNQQQVGNSSDFGSSRAGGMLPESLVRTLVPKTEEGGEHHQHGLTRDFLGVTAATTSVATHAPNREINIASLMSNPEDDNEANIESLGGKEDSDKSWDHGS